MTAYVHRPWIVNPLLRAGSSLGRRLAMGVRYVQYGQMIAVLNRLPDSYLNQTGVRRCDIPEHARRLVYGDCPAQHRRRK